MSYGQFFRFSRFLAIVLIVNTYFQSVNMIFAIETENKYDSIPLVEVPIILDMSSDFAKRNYERIISWQGEINYSVDTIFKGKTAKHMIEEHVAKLSIDPNVVLSHAEGVYQYVIDMKKDCLKTNLIKTSPTVFTDMENCNIYYAKTRPVNFVYIITPQYFMYSMPYEIQENSILSRKAKKEKPTSKTCGTIMSGVFDPRSSFEFGQPVWEILSKINYNLKKYGDLSIDGYKLKVGTKIIDDCTEYRVQIPGKISRNNYIFTTVIFSSNSGYNIVMAEVTDGRGFLSQKGTWTYELIDGIYLPKKVTKINYSHSDKMISNETTYIFKNSKINHEIPEETFTYKKLGLQNGDKYIDTISNKKYIYQDNQLVPTNE